ncbi:hypothetical protein EMPG_11421 [Blastomyces silverae]|uniref:Uncharacterized protein n=1 Tax=Blastomyces silverae TaxID=2060906 RepID=A0A0H1BRC3_9EURO|nr:hypothetical protein EMPG_11421 [Blastomyces silverae]
MAPKHHIYYRQHKSAHRFLAGDALRRMTERFTRVLMEELHRDAAIGPDDDDDWCSCQITNLRLLEESDLPHCRARPVQALSHPADSGLSSR